MVSNVLPNRYTAALTMSNAFNLYVCLSVFVCLRVSSFNNGVSSLFSCVVLRSVSFFPVVFTLAYVFPFTLLSFL